MLGAVRARKETKAKAPAGGMGGGPNPRVKWDDDEKPSAPPAAAPRVVKPPPVVEDAAFEIEDDIEVMEDIVSEDDDPW